MSGADAGFGGLLLLAVLVLSLAMTLAWGIQRTTGNSGWIDTIWSASTGLTAMLVIVLSGPMTPHRWAILLLVGAWSLRLALHIGRRTLRAADDPRYRALIGQWGNEAGRKLWSFLQAQAAAGGVLAACALLAASKPGAITVWDMASYALAVAALAGETAADKQLRAFKEQRRGHDAICDTGLWGLSRHPNYFFEWLFWLAVALSALGLDPSYAAGWLSLLAPAMMYVVLVYGSGVPHSEAQMLRTRGAKFAAYQQRVPMFFPDLRRLLGGR